MDRNPSQLPSIDTMMPRHRSLFYGGAWHETRDRRTFEVISPSTGESLGQVANASAADVEDVLRSAREGYRVWRDVAPAERARILRRMAQIVREHAEELAMLDAIDC